MFPIYQICYCQFFNNCFVFHTAKAQLYATFFIVDEVIISSTLSKFRKQILRF